MNRFEENMHRLLSPLHLYRLQDDTIVAKELSSYAAGFALVEQEGLSLLREALVPTAESFGLALREQLMGFPANAKLDMQTRREILIHALTIAPQSFNRAGMEKGLRSIGLDAEIIELQQPETLQVTARQFLGNFVSYDQLRADALRILPAHLLVEFEFGTFTWEQFDTKDLSFDSFDSRAFTWDEFEMIGKTL